MKIQAMFVLTISMLQEKDNILNLVILIYFYLI